MLGCVRIRASQVSSRVPLSSDFPSGVCAKDLIAAQHEVRDGQAVACEEALRAEQVIQFHGRSSSGASNVSSSSARCSCPLPLLASDNCRNLVSFCQRSGY
jgi:hypothetical protein